MSDPFLGEIRAFGFGFAPKGWTTCNGQLLPINQNQALFALLGTYFGGNGQTTFALPNLQGRVGVSQGSNYVQGQTGGEMNHTLNQSEIPQHTHQVMCNSGAGTALNPGGALPAANADVVQYSNSAGVNLSPQAVQTTGKSQPHTNMAPYLVVNFCIALQGIFPSRN